MGKIFGTCGHELEFNEKTQQFGNSMIIWEIDREGEPGQASILVCDTCVDFYMNDKVPDGDIWIKP